MAECKARVRLELEVSLSQPWTELSTVQEIHRAARREAVEQISAMIDSRRNVSLVLNSTKVTMVIADGPFESPSERAP